MKKGLYSLFFVTIFLTFLAGCGGSSKPDAINEADWKPTPYETVDNLDEVTMNVNDDAVSSTGLIITLENNSDKQYEYGEEFMLEKKVEEDWHQVPVTEDDNYGFNDIGYDLAASKTEKSIVDWDWLYGNLTTGEYRIVKGIHDVREPGDYDEHFLTAEFIIE